MRDLPITTPGSPVPSSPPGMRWRRRCLRIGLLAGACGAFLALGGFSWQLWRPPDPPGAAAAPPPPDESLHCRLRQSLVRIAPEGGAGGGSGTLLDREARLVVTTESAVGDRPEARVFFPPDPATAAAAGPAIAARVVYRDACRRVVLLRLDRVPGWTLPVPLGEQAVVAPGRRLLSVRLTDPAGQTPAEGPSWSDTRAEIGQVYQPPHH